MITSVPMTENRIREIQSTSVLQLLKTVILKGGHTDKLGILPKVLPYFHIRDELSVQDRLIFRSERVVIPITLRKIYPNALSVEQHPIPNNNKKIEIS